MLAHVFCHNLVTQSLLWMHKKTRESLKTHVNSLLANETKLSLSSIGRNLPGSASEKSKINMTWRFLCNKRIETNTRPIYRDIFKNFLSGLDELIIAVDWSGCCSHDNYLLRASLVFEGRSIVIYNEVHPQKMLAKEQVHNAFLKNLSSILPGNKPVVIITDGGFKTPWFSAIQKLGWYFVGRIRGKFSYKLKERNDWLGIEELYSQTCPGESLFIGACELGKKAYKTRSNGVIVTHWESKKGRKSKSPRYPDVEKRYSELNSEPWVIFSNLHQNEHFSNEKDLARFVKVVKNIYAKRMQIEQNFRDDKSIRYGFGWRLSGTNNPSKINVLLLLVAVASFKQPPIIFYKTER